MSEDCHDPSDLVEIGDQAEDDISIESIIGDDFDFEEIENIDIKEVLRKRMTKIHQHHAKKINERIGKNSQLCFDEIVDEASRVFEEEMQNRMRKRIENLSMLGGILSKIKNISGVSSSRIINAGLPSVGMAKIWNSTVSLTLTEEEYEFLKKCYRNPVSVLKGTNSGRDKGTG